MNRLSFTNPVFSTYAVAASLMIFKSIGMAWLTVYRMVKVRGGFRSPEDIRPTPLNPNPSPEQLLPNEYVERVRRIHHNDLENLPFFLVAGLLFVLTDPSPLHAQVVFTTYVVSRLLHFAAYLTARTHDTRAVLWTLGVVVLMYMTGRVLLHGLVALGGAR